MIEQYECLIVVFRPQLTLALSKQSSKRRLQLDDREYLDSKDQQWTCFYDWLRNASKQVVGVRLWLWSELSQLVEYLGKYSYTRVGNEGKSIEVFFSNDHQFVAEFSKDQEFYENRILESSDREYSITFGTRYLANSDIQRIKLATAQWKRPAWSG